MNEPNHGGGLLLVPVDENNFQKRDAAGQIVDYSIHHFEISDKGRLIEVSSRFIEEGQRVKDGRVEEQASLGGNSTNSGANPQNNNLKYEVEKKCGQPMHKDIDRWYYKKHDTTYVLEFQNGELEVIDVKPADM